MNDKNMIRMEKKAANKLGLLIVFALTIVGTIFGAYLLYENKDNLDFSLPWEKQEETQEETKEEKPPKENKNNTSGGRLYLPEVNEDQNFFRTYKIAASANIQNLKATTAGYEFEFVVKTNNYNNTLIVKCTRILIDGYEVSPTFEINASQKPNTLQKALIKIPLAELENLEINNFKTLQFFVEVEYKSGYGIAKGNDTYVAQMIQDVIVDNNKEELDSFAPQENVRISYHKKIEVSDATYLYFVVNNNNKTNDYKIELSKFIVDDKIYNDIEVNVVTHHLCKNVFFIKIPKKKVRKPKQATIAFVITRDADDGKHIFITPTKTLDLAK